MDVLLVLANKKIAVEVDVMSEYTPHTENQAATLDDEIARTEAALRKLGLHIHHGNRERFDREGGHVDMQRFYVSKSAKEAQNLSVAFEGDERQYAKELGRTFGFPATAVAAYDKVLHEGLDSRKKYYVEEDELPVDLREQPFMAFAQFKLSKEHWQEELDTARTWSTEVQRADPALYERMVRDHQDLLKLQPIRTFVVETLDTIDGQEGSLAQKKDRYDELIVEIERRISNLPDAVSAHAKEELRTNIARGREQITRIIDGAMNEPSMTEEYRRRIRHSFFRML